MAFGRSNLGSSTGGGGGRAMGGGAQRPLSDINVTPLVDVMLVLLVIFIIAAPLMASAIKLELPRSGAAQPVDAPRFVSLAVDAQGALSVDGQPVPDEAALTQRLQAAAGQGADTELQLRADRSVPYGRVVELMGLANEAGLSRIAFVTEAGAAASAPR
ncbi:MAG: biopolymer transporter ExbD [Comamonadaceae bacterium]|nr:MAG: biopolymer transporter ExbD [Comamonadaceae bacterium]